MTVNALSASFYDLPADCHKIRSVQVQYGSTGGWETLVRANAADDRGCSVTAGYPYAYREFPSQLEVLPYGSTQPLRLSYCPVASLIVDGTELIPATDGFDQVVVLRTLIMAIGRENSESVDWQRQLTDIEGRFRESIRRRDRSQPMRLQPRGGNRRRRRTV
jgi:hypothetical protein